MNFTPEKLKTARDNGYTDDEIWSFLGKDDQRFNLAKENGYTLDDTINTFSKISPPEEEPSGVLRQAADIPVQFAKGIGTGIRGFTDIIGADNPISKSIAGYEDYMDSLLSAESKNDSKRVAQLLQEAQNKGILDKISAGFEAFASAPIETTANVAGYMVPQLALGLVGKAAQIGKAAQMGLTLGTGFVQGVGTAKGNIYQNTKEYLREQGVPEDQIEPIAVKAQSYNGENLDQLLLSGGLNALAASTGAEAILTRVLTKQGKEVSGGIIGGILKGAGAEAPIEGVQSAQEEVTKNIALQRLGYDVPTFQGAIESATTGLLAGGFVGGLAGGVEALSPEQKEQRDIEKEAERRARELEASNAATQAISAELTRLERGIDNKRMDLDALEPTSPEASKMRLDIAADQSKLAVLKEQANKLGLSETITEAEKRQIELGKLIAAPPEEKPAKLPTMPSIEEQEAGVTYGGETGLYDVFGGITRKPAVMPKEAKLPTMPTLEEQTAETTYGGQTGVFDVFSGARRKPVVTEEPPVSMVGKQVIPGVTPVPVVAKAPTEPTVKESLTVAPEAPAAKELQIGDEITIMQVPSVLADTKKIAGVKWDIFNGAKLAEKRAAVRITDEESGEVLQIKQFKNYDEAETYFKTETDKAQKLEKPAPEAPAITPTPVAETPADVTTEKRASVLNEFIQKELQRQVDEQRGQQVLDNMEEAGESPRLVVEEFYRNIYDNLPQNVRARFDKYVKRMGWPIPANMDSSPKSIGIEGAVDLGNDVQGLEGIERGFVALVRTANDLYAQAQAKPTATPTLELVAPVAETPAVASAAEPAGKTATPAQEDVKFNRYRKFLGESAPQAISEARNALSTFKTTMLGKRGDSPFQAEPRLRELKNVISLFVANRLNVKNQNADQIAEQIILGKPNIVDKVTELKPIKAKELDDIEANRSAIMRFGYELDDKKTYRHPREAEVIAATPAAEPAGISVGSRIKLGKSPQTYIVEEAIPQTEVEKANNEQFYSVKNERTGETQVVEARDLKQVKGKGARKIAAAATEKAGLWATPPQEISSAATSINQRLMPSTFKRVEWKSGTRNADIGGGRFDNATEFLSKSGVENVIYDPYNRTQESNKAAVAKISGGQSDTATINNVLNVIAEPESRELVIRQAADAIKEDGKAYFLIYEGNAKGVGSQTKAGWQENRRAETYVDEISKHFGSVTRKGNLIIAEKPSKPLDVRRQAIDTTPEGILITPPDQQYTFNEVFDVAYDMFGGEIPEGFTIVNDSKDKDFEFKAAYIPESGEIIVNLAYLNKNDDIRDAITHELGHYIYSDPQFQADFKKFWELMTPEEKAKADQIINQFYNKETGAVQIEEKQVRAFMQLIQDSKAMPKWKQILDKIKSWINEKLKTNFQVTDRGALAVLAVAHKRFKSGERIIREMKSGVLKTAETAQDAEYLAAVERGDMATAQRMVDEAAKKAGYDTFATHRTNARFTVFDANKINKRDSGFIGDGFYFSPGGISQSNDGYGRNAYEVYLSGKFLDLNPRTADIDKIQQAVIDQVNEKRVSKGLEKLKTTDTQYQRIVNDFKMDAAMAESGIGAIASAIKKSGYVSTIAKRMGFDGAFEKNEIVVFSPNQIKSADPVTYDDAGNVIPLEERFQPTSPDIRREAATIQQDEAVTPIPEANRYTFEEAVKAVDAHFGKQGIPEGVVIVNNTTEPDLEMKAGYFVNRGQIVINLAYIAKGENLGDIIDHELGHYIFGDPKFQADFKKFWELMTPEEKAKADQIINQFYNKDTGAVQMEEKQVRAFMQLIQDSKAMPKWKQLLDKIKRWINEKLGTNLQVTDRGALAVLAAAHKRFKSGEQIVREIDSGVLKTAETAQDAEYLAAVERGDMETAQRMVDEAAKKAGYAIDSYHGTNGDLFTIFSTERGGDKTFAESARLGIFSTDNPDVAQTYAENIGAGGTFALGLGQGPLAEARDRAISTPEFKAFSQAKDAAEKEYSAASKRIYDQYLEIEKAQLQSARGAFRSMLQNKTEAEIDAFIEEVAARNAIREFSADEAVNKKPELIAAQEKINEATKAINNYIYPFLLEALPNVRVMKLKLQIKNPKVYDAQGQTPADFSLSDKIQEAKDLGHDGVIFENIIDPQLPATHYVVFEPQQIKSADPVTYDDAGDVIPLSQRFQPSEPDIRRMAVDPTGERKSIMGEELGELKDTPKNIIAKTKELLRERVLNPSEVTEKNTTEAFRALGKLLGNKQERRDFADELNNIATIVDDTGAAAEVSMGAALFVNDLFEYAVRLAAQGDKKMLGIMMSKINDLPTATEGRSDAGRALRAAREMKDTFLTMAKAEQDAFINYAAEFVYGPNPTKQQVDSIKIGYDAVEKVQEPTAKEVEEEIAAVGEKTGTDLVGRINDEFTKATEKGKAKRKTEIEELDSEYKKIQEQADKEIEKLAKIQSDTPSFDPTAARQTANDVRAIVANDLKQRPDMGRKAPWKSMLVAKLQEAGVDAAAAETLADIVWRQHEINNLSRELSSINKAVEKGPISEIIKAIKETPLEEQQNPNWRYEVMRDYLRKAGLSVAQAERIAKLMDISLQKRFTQAKEQAFTDAISKTAPWKAGDVRSKRAFQQVLQAIRAGALDPSRNMASDIAAMNGWTGFTADQYKNLLKNDAILANEDSKDIQKAEAYKAVQDIISKSKLPIRARDVIGQYYDAQALSGIPTLAVNTFSPIAFAMRNAIVQAGSGTIKGDAKAIGKATTAFVDSIKSWANTVAFSFKNNVTVYSNVDYIVNDDNLLRLYRKGVDQFTKSKNAKERADGVKNMMIGMMDYVRRILNALDYGAIASLQNQNISKYAMEVMKRQKMNNKQANEMFGVMMKAKNDFYLQQVAIGTDKNKASILADEFYISSWKEALSKAGVEKSDIQQAMDAAINDALSSVGRNRQSLDAFKEEDTKLKDAGVSSMPALWLLESIANAANRSDNQVVKLFSRVIYGFAIVPARVIRETAWFSPYGFVRFGYDYIAKSMGKTSPYAQSLGTDIQYSQRLNEAVAGTVALLGLMALRAGSTDDPEDEDAFKIVFTGNGPQRKDDAQFYDSWYKAGNKPNSMIVSFGKTKFTLNMMRGFEAFTWPAMMLGAIDDLEIRKKQKQQTKTPGQLEDAAIVAGFVFDAALRRGPYAFTTKSLFGTYGDIGVEGVAKGLTFPAKTLIPVLGTSLASNLSNFLNDPIDRRTLDGAVWSNIPFIGPAVAPKSLNAFGEPSLSTDLASKMFKLGVPIVYDIPTDRESIKLHELVLKQGGGPSIPTRNQLAQRLDRQPTNKEYEMFVREYGTILTKSMKKNYDKLFNAKPELYSKAVDRIGLRARDVAENKVRQAAKKP